MSNSDKSLEELRAAIDSDQEEGQANTGTQSNVKAEETKDASSNDEGTSKEASEATQSEGTSKEEDTWVVPGRFKSQEDVLKAYGELESFTGRQSSEIQKLRNAVLEPPRRGESIDEKNTRLKKFAAELEQDPEGAIETRIRRVVNEVKGDVRASEFRRVYESRKSDSTSDFAALEPIMADIATNYSDMITANNLQNDPRLLDILHLAARGIKASEIARKAEAKGVKKGEEVSRQKGKARLETTSGTSKSKKPDIKTMTAAQLRSAIEKGDLE